jgi:hypothetical protein
MQPRDSKKSDPGFEYEEPYESFKKEAKSFLEDGVSRYRTQNDFIEDLLQRA